jgi:uncharacterized protein YecE (DUF72 family)
MTATHSTHAKSAERIRVGPAGWSYPDWDGRVYPSVRPHGFHPLAHLARYFDCIEINSTFYATPRREHAERWAQLVADRADFRFLVKLQRDFTHLPEDPGADSTWEHKARDFKLGIEPLVRAKKLSALLVQFPVSFLHGKSEVRRLGRLRALFDGLPLVLEMRHESWFTPPALAVLRGLSYSLAYIDLPAAWNHPPPWHESTGPIGYLRLHGRNSAQWFRHDSERDDKYDYLYDRTELEGLVQRARRIAGQHDHTAVVTNNHFSGKAVANAIEILFLLDGQPPLAPLELIESFPELASITKTDGQGGLF